MHHWAEQRNFKAKLCCSLKRREEELKRWSETEWRRIKWRSPERQYEPSISTELDFQRSSEQSSARPNVSALNPSSIILLTPSVRVRKSPLRWCLLHLPLTYNLEGCITPCLVFNRGSSILIEQWMCLHAQSYTDCALKKQTMWA